MIISALASNILALNQDRYLTGFGKTLGHDFFLLVLFDLSLKEYYVKLEPCTRCANTCVNKSSLRSTNNLECWKCWMMADSLEFWTCLDHPTDFALFVLELPRNQSPSAAKNFTELSSSNFLYKFVSYCSKYFIIFWGCIDRRVMPIATMTARRCMLFPASLCNSSSKNGRNITRWEGMVFKTCTGFLSTFCKLESLSPKPRQSHCISGIPIMIIASAPQGAVIDIMMIGYDILDMFEKNLVLNIVGKSSDFSSPVRNLCWVGRPSRNFPEGLNSKVSMEFWPL